jgi:hypothetical protein
MSLHESAKKETSALINRLLTVQAERNTQHLQTVRRMLDEALAEADATLLVPPVPDESELSEIVGRLTMAADAYAQARIDVVSEEARQTIDGLHRQREELAQRQDALVSTIERLRNHSQTLLHDLDAQKALTSTALTDGASAKAALERAERELQTVTEFYQTERVAKATLEREIPELQAALADARAEVARLQGERDAAAAAHQAAITALNAATTQAEEHKEQRGRTEALLEASSAHLSSLKQANDQHATVLRELEQKLAIALEAEQVSRQQAQTAEASCTQLRASLEAAVHAAEAQTRAAEAWTTGSAMQHLEAVDGVQHAVAFLSLSLDRLLAVSQKLANGASVEDLLTSITFTLGSEFSRVVLFSVEDNRFEAVRQTGCELPADLSQVVTPSAIDELLSRAIASGQIEMSSGEALAASGETFGGTPATILAVPILVDREPVAVAYADDSDQPHRELAPPELRIKYAELVRRVATPLLGQLMNERRELAALDNYAGLLVKQLQTTHAADVRAGAPEVERLTHLSQNLDYARRLFAQRAHAQGPRAALLLDEQLSAITDADKNAPLGRDLAAVINGSATHVASWSESAQVS